MALSDFVNSDRSISLYSRCFLCSHYVNVVQKSYVLHKKLCQQKKIFRIAVNVAHQNYVSHTKNMLWQQKK